MKQNLTSYLKKHRFPYSTFCLLIVIGAMLVLQVDQGALGVRHKTLDLGGVSQLLVSEGEFYRLVIASFLHVNIGHFIANVTGLFIVGGLLEILLGSRTIIIIFLVSALAGTLTSIGLQVVPWMVGASTILYGVYGALGALLLRYRRNHESLFTKRLAIWLSIILASNIIPIFVLDRVDHGAHIGGFAGGFVTTWIITTSCSLQELRETPGKRVIFTSFVLFVIFIFGFVAGLSNI